MRWIKLADYPSAYECVLNTLPCVSSQITIRPPDVRLPV